MWAFPGTAMAAPVLPDGIRVQGRIWQENLWGARDVIETYEEELGNCPVILTLDGQEKETTAKELGLTGAMRTRLRKRLRSTPEAA